MPDRSDSATPDVQPGEITRIARSSVMLSATIKGFGAGAESRHRVRDLSAGGIRIDQAANLQAGATVLISVGSLEAVGATIKWVRDGSAGLAFAEQIDPDQARGRAAITAPSSNRRTPARPVERGSFAPTAGWVGALNDPYRR